MVRRQVSAVLALLVLVLFGAAAAASAAPERAGPTGTTHAAQPAKAAAAQKCTVGMFKETPPPKNPDDIKACMARFHGITVNENAISINVVITDKKTDLPPAINYGVFLVVHKPGEEAKQPPVACLQPHYSTNPEYPLGVYRCSWLVDAPGKYVFDVTINKPGVGSFKQLLRINQTLDITNAVKLSGGSNALRYVVQGSNFDVFLLQAHVAAASIWLLMVTVMAFLAVPQLRKLCSVLTLHVLELRRAFFNSVMWAMFLCVLGSGIYLLRTQTAYKAPFSFSAWDNITKLPYATQYFSTLYAKIAIFVIMAVASVVLSQEAARRARLSDSGPEEDTFDDEMWGRSLSRIVEGDGGESGAGIAAPSGGGTGTKQLAGSTKVTHAQPKVAEGVSVRTLWLCVLVVAGGMGAIGVCVTVLKYTHEMIEMLIAAQTVAGGG